MNYTQEMLEQDTLVKEGKGNTEKIKELQKSIVEQAVKEGLTNESEIAEHDTCYSLIRSLVIDEKDAQLRIAIVSALEEFSGENILKIMQGENEEEHSGWSGRASMLNEADPEDVKNILQKMNKL